MYSQPLIIQAKFLGIPVTGNAIQHPVTMYISHTLLSKKHIRHTQYHNASG